MLSDPIKTVSKFKKYRDLLVKKFWFKYMDFKRNVLYAIFLKQFDFFRLSTSKALGNE
jgi:hypothetical protein